MGSEPRAPVIEERTMHLSWQSHADAMSQHSESTARRRHRPAEPGAIKLFVETLTGSAFEMTVSPLDTVLAIKTKICRVEGIPISQQHLLYKMRELDNSSALHEHGIGDRATLRLVLSMHGGPVSMHRLLPSDIKDLVDGDRDDTEWGAPGGGRVTLLLVRDGDRVSVSTVVENEAGAAVPLLDIINCRDGTAVAGTSSTKSVVQEARADGVEAPDTGDENCGPLLENAVTMRKMMALRRRMDSLSLQCGRRHDRRRTERADVKPLLKAKTRSEEALPTTRDSDALLNVLDGIYTRLDYECSFADRYTLLPPIFADSEVSSGEDEHLVSAERLALSDALAGSILVKSGDDDAIAEDAEWEHARLSNELLARPLPAPECGPLVGGETGASWRGARRAFGSSSHLPPPAPLAPAHSASSLQLRPPAPPAPRPLPLEDALFSCSTSDLEQLRRNRLLPALCRHRNREHLDVSDERLDRPPPAPCSLEVGSERRHRRIRKIAELQRAEATFNVEDGYESVIRKLPNDAVTERLDAVRVPEPQPVDTPPPAAEEAQHKKITRIRCGFCRKRLSIATIHHCRCGGEYCAPHRYAEVHGCAYDYKAHAPQYPLVSAPKLPKI